MRFRRLWLCVAVVALHMVLWQLTPVYRVFPWTDRLIHLAGGAAAAWLLLAWWPPRMVVLAMLGVVAGWELFEWGLDQFGVTESQRSGRENLMDMLMGLIGASLLCILVRKK